jgi:hypothetical protein
MRARRYLWEASSLLEIGIREYGLSINRISMLERILVWIELVGKFDSPIPCFVTTVKLDLEAQGEIEPVSCASPQRIRRK